MKNTFTNLVFVLLFLFLGYNNIFANTWEFSMEVTSEGTTPEEGVPIYLYYENDVDHGFLTPFRHCTSSYVNSGVNFDCDVDDNNTANPSWPSIPHGIYYLRVNNDYVELDINQYTGSGAGDFELLYDANSHNFSIIYNERGINLGTTSTWSYSEVSVSINQQLQNGTSTGVVNRWNGAFVPLTNFPNTYLFSNNSTQILRGAQNIQSGEKYNNWGINFTKQNDVTNHHSFPISTQTSSLISNFLPTYDATLQSILLDDGSTIGAPNFLDPWFIDTTDSYGPRNQGMNDWAHSVTYSQNDIGISSVHLGVFLNQLVSSGTYYSVKTPATKNVGGYTALFDGWTDSPSGSVTFQNAFSTSTPVVFNSGGAAVTANYSRTSISENVTLVSGTYNFIGNLTVNSGATLTINSGATLEFPAGSGLIVNGKLIANGGTFTASSGNWNGITLNSAEGSSIQNTTISYALSPLIINSTNSITISG